MTTKLQLPMEPSLPVVTISKIVKYPARIGILEKK